MKTKLLALLVLPLAIGSCSKDKDNANPGPEPKEYQVEYRITAVNYVQARSVVYRDATGNQVTDEYVSLPKAYAFKRVMKSSDVLSVGAFPLSGDAAASVTCTILLDGKSVSTKTDPGPSPQTVATYQIP